MSALPCPVAIRFAAADQTYGDNHRVPTFRGGAASESIAELERHVGGDGAGVAAGIAAGHLTCANPGKAVEPVRDGRRRAAHAHPGPYAQPGEHLRRVEVARTGYGAGRHTQSAPAGPGAESAAGEVLSGSAAASGDRSGPRTSFDEGVKTLEVYTGAHVPKRQFGNWWSAPRRISRRFTPSARQAARADRTRIPFWY